MLGATTMKAVVIREPGGPDVLEVREVARPEPGTGQVLVKVEASGVNRADLAQRLGRYPAPPGWPPDIPGLEFAGTVEACGPHCRARFEGNRVMGLVGGGGYAEYVAVHEDAVVPVPVGLSSAEAGAVPEVFMTAFDAVHLQMGLVAGETLLVHAVGSGVGTAALQLARAEGAIVFGTSRSPDKLRRAEELGLDAGIPGGEAPWPVEVLTRTRGRGVDVILDLVGAPYVAGNLSVLAERARWVVVGVTGGAATEFDLRGLMRKRASITGTVLRARPLEEKVALARAFEERVLPLFEDGSVRPVLDATYTPERAREAHARLEENLNFGKLVLVWE